MLDLQSPISELSRTSSVTISKLEKKGIKTVEDLLMILPLRWFNAQHITPIHKLILGEPATVVGSVTSTHTRRTRTGGSIQTVVLTDSTGSVSITWFNQPFIIRRLSEMKEVAVAGTLQKNYLGLDTFEPFEIDFASAVVSGSSHVGRLIPIYSEKYGISSHTLREKIFRVLSEVNTLSTLPNKVPLNIRKKHDLLLPEQIVRFLHAPQNEGELEKAKFSRMFELLFERQIISSLIQESWKKQKASFTVKSAKIDKQILKFVKNLPYKLTTSQQNCVDDIVLDMKRSYPMNRLLSGDVGSGKTVVACVAAYISALSGFRTLFMVPTELLARQHEEVIKNLFKATPFKVGLWTGSEKINDPHKPTILVGTHALLHIKIPSEDIGLVVIDEQHKFGVEQRTKLKQLAKSPHVLTMTATPIPRTIALTLHGFLSLSFIDSVLPGRIPIKTFVVSESKRSDAYQWITNLIQKETARAYIVCPLITNPEASGDQLFEENTKQVKTAVEEFEKLSKTVFRTLNPLLVHGKMTAKEKNDKMTQFRTGKSPVLVTTPVIEVGIDVPQARIIVIETAERFGLAQLHQLRGRVGRGSKQSYCLLFSNDANPDVINRLSYFAHTTSGMKISEYDLQKRGPGSFFGLKQHGYDVLTIEAFRNPKLVSEVQKTVQDLYDKGEVLKTAKFLKISAPSEKVSPN